jgi:hypothetical protein
VQAPEPYVPPPDVPVPAPQAPVIQSVAPTPPPPEQPYVIQPPAPVVAVAPPAPPKPAIRKDPQRKSGDDLVYPRAAIRAVSARAGVVARVMIDEKGQRLRRHHPVGPIRPGCFDRTVIDGVKDWKYAAEGEKYVAEIEVIFVLKE